MKTRSFLFLFAAAAGTLLRAQSVPPTPDAFKFGTGFDYSRGDYGFTDDTEVLSIPANFLYEHDRWIFRAAVPYLRIKGPASVVAGSGVARPTSQSESGLGDVTLSGTYHARPVPGAWNVDLTGRVKLPTADDAKGLGTGETDYFAQVDLYRAYDTFIPFVTAGYRWLGRNATYPLKDGAFASAGSSLRLSKATVLGAAFDWRSRILDGAKNATDVTVFVATNPDPSWSFTGYVVKGLNDASPDFGVGAGVTYKF